MKIVLIISVVILAVAAAALVLLCLIAFAVDGAIVKEFEEWKGK